MNHKIAVSCVILAGGKSKRMGRDKALLPIGKQIMLERLLDLVTPMFNETIIIVDRVKKLNSFALGKAKVYEDILENQGPLVGLYTGLVYSRNVTSCVLTCDMPLLDQSLLQKLLDGEEAGEDVICYSCQPFPGLYRRRSRSLIRLLLDHGKRALKDYLRLAGVKSLALRGEEEKALVNMNTPEEYERILSHAFSR